MACERVMYRCSAHIIGFQKQNNKKIYLVMSTNKCIKLEDGCFAVRICCVYQKIYTQLSWENERTREKTHFELIAAIV